ncbi:hypothetical protein LCGC14_1077260 [marine sediment metagenome]|uniref:DUF4190 domain-containing protein n=1 Tax=marine sediment metagenome TaxID=412755 RepID=A0A0F9MGE9_9ZZZZ
MGSTFGIIGLICSIIAGVIMFSPFSYPGLVIILIAVAIIFSFIGIISDDSKAPGIIGLIIGIILIILPLFVFAWFASFFP